MDVVKQAIELTTRQRFEEDCKHIPKLAAMNFAKTKLGKYVSNATDAVWQGYELYHQMLTKRARVPEAHLFTGAPYIVARLDSSGRPVTGIRPYRHPVASVARAEADRLANLHGGIYSIWRLAEIHAPKEKEVEDAVEGQA